MMNDSSKSTDRLLSTLGLCVKAGKVIFGVPMVCEAMRKGGKNAPVLVLEAADTSDNTHKKISDKCNYYNTKHIRLHIGGEQLAAALGKSAQLGAVAVTDEGLGDLVEKSIRVISDNNI